MNAFLQSCGKDTAVLELDRMFLFRNLQVKVTEPQVWHSQMRVEIKQHDDSYPREPCPALPSWHELSDSEIR